MNQTPHIQLLIAQSTEAEVLKKTTAGLGNILVFVENLGGLYQGLQNHYTEHAKNNPLTPEQSVLLQSVMTCRHQFVLGTLTLLRGHLGDAFGYLRKALEYTLFAARTLQQQDSALAWLNAASSDQSWSDYIGQFKIHNMTHSNQERLSREWSNLIDDLPRLQRVINAYDVASRRLHATVLAAGPDQQEGGLVFYDSYVDYLALEEPSRLIDPYLFMIYAHLDILDVQSRVLLKRSGISFNESAWLGVFKPIEKQYNDTVELRKTEIAKNTAK